MTTLHDKLSANQNDLSGFGQFLQSGIHNERALDPLYREEKDGSARKVTWRKACTIFRDRIQEVQQIHGPEAVAFLGTGHLNLEEIALLGAFARFEVGIKHGDWSSGPNGLTSDEALLRAFGFEAPPCCYGDLEESDVVVLFGSDLRLENPLLWQRILHNPFSPEVIVIDHRETNTALQATRFVKYKEGTDLILLNCIAHMLIRKGYVNYNFIAQHTRGFERFSEFIAQFTPLHAIDECGVGIADLEVIAQKIGEGRRVSLWWTLEEALISGLGSRHVGTIASALINLALMTGQIGRPGCGASPISPPGTRCSSLFNSIRRLPGGRDFEIKSDRQRVAEILKVAPHQIPFEAGKRFPEIIRDIQIGKIKALWLICSGDEARRLDRELIKELARNLDFFAVQDHLSTSSSAVFADLLLPSSDKVEKTGVTIDSERRIRVQEKTAYPPGKALSDFKIIRKLGAVWKTGHWFSKWSTPKAVFEVLKELSAGQPCDITGIQGYRQLQGVGLQWPVSESHYGPIAAENRLFENLKFFTPDQKARFVWEQSVAVIQTSRQ